MRRKLFRTFHCEGLRQRSEVPWERNHHGFTKKDNVLWITLKSGDAHSRREQKETWQCPWIIGRTTWNTASVSAINFCRRKQSLWSHFILNRLKVFWIVRVLLMTCLRIKKEIRIHSVTGRAISRAQPLKLVFPFLQRFPHRVSGKHVEFVWMISFWPVYAKSFGYSPKWFNAVIRHTALNIAAAPKSIEAGRGGSNSCKVFRTWWSSPSWPLGKLWSSVILCERMHAFYLVRCVAQIKKNIFNTYNVFYIWLPFFSWLRFQI